MYLSNMLYVKTINIKCINGIVKESKRCRNFLQAYLESFLLITDMIHNLEMWEIRRRIKFRKTWTRKFTHLKTVMPFFQRYFLISLNYKIFWWRIICFLFIRIGESRSYSAVWLQREVRERTELQEGRHLDAIHASQQRLVARRSSWQGGTDSWQIYYAQDKVSTINYNKSYFNA